MTHHGSGPEGDIRWIKRYTPAERWLHWGHTVSFFVLLFTGFPLFAEFLAPLVQGEAGQFLRLWHRAAAVSFMGVGVAYFLIEPRQFIQNIRDLSLGKEDLGWVKAAIPYYLFGRHDLMPPQGRWNTGEKMNVLIQSGSGLLFIITGLIMWFAKGIAPPEIFMVAVVIHDLAMIVSVTMFIVHLYLVMAHPLMWAALISMRFGVASREFAQGHHAKWYEEQHTGAKYVSGE